MDLLLFTFPIVRGPDLITIASLENQISPTTLFVPWKQDLQWQLEMRNRSWISPVDFCYFYPTNRLPKYIKNSCFRKAFIDSCKQDISRYLFIFGPTKYSKVQVAIGLFETWQIMNYPGTSGQVSVHLINFRFYLSISVAEEKRACRCRLTRMGASSSRRNSGADAGSLGSSGARHRSHKHFRNKR